MNQQSPDSTALVSSINPNARASAGIETGPKVLATTAPGIGDFFRAKRRSKNIEADSERRRSSLPVIFRRTFSSSPPSAEQPQEDVEPGAEKSDDDPIDQPRRRSLREAIIEGISTLKQKLSEKSPSPKSRRSSDIDISQPIDLPSETNGFSRPDECSDMTELDYLRRKGIMEAKRGRVYQEDEYSLFETEAAEDATTENAPPEGVQLPLRTSSLPNQVRPDPEVQHRRPKSDDSLVQRLSGQVFTPLLRDQSRKAIRKAYLRQSPEDWTEYNVPEAEFFIQQTQTNALKSALEQVIEHEKCRGMEGHCEHKYRSRGSEEHDENGLRNVEEVEDDQGRDGEWFATMEEALTAEK